MPNWTLIPNGPQYHETLERLAGSNWDPDNGKYGFQWYKLRYGPSVRQNAHCAIYYDPYQLPDGRILVMRYDQVRNETQAAFFSTGEQYRHWAQGYCYNPS